MGIDRIKSMRWSFFSGPKVDFYGDFIDPFGYIGFHNLRVAAEEQKIQIRWRGFELNPDTPPEGYRFQTAQNSDLRPGMWASVSTYAQKAGLQLRDPGFAPQTRWAHFLVLNWPGDTAAKNPLIERIYGAYLSEQKDIGNKAILIEIARSFGVSETNCNAALSPDHLKILDQHRDEAMKHQFTGMPAYRFRNQTSFGALNAEHWRGVFKT
jgi:predicted DsbA family dithiol-disulfide isomerase